MYCWDSGLLRPLILPFLLSTMSKSAQSGLRSIKRDFSTSSMASSSSQEIYWPPAPQPVAAPKLTGPQQRLKDIQDALSGNPTPPKRSVPLVESKGINKRQSPEVEAPPVAKRARQLPPSWGSKDALSDSSLSSKPATSSSRSTVSRTAGIVKPEKTAAPHSSSSKSKPKVASVFLSQEQTQILKLVQDGHSVFYTGSAGQ
jgi:hypothetical protein